MKPQSFIIRYASGVLSAGGGPTQKPIGNASACQREAEAVTAGRVAEGGGFSACAIMAMQSAAVMPKPMDWSVWFIIVGLFGLQKVGRRLRLDILDGTSQVQSDMAIRCRKFARRSGQVRDDGLAG